MRPLLFRCRSASLRCATMVNFFRRLGGQIVKISEKHPLYFILYSLYFILIVTPRGNADTPRGNADTPWGNADTPHVTT